MTDIMKDNQWIRNPQHHKYYATVFGITRTDNVFRIEIGKEQMTMPDKKKASISDCQIIMDQSGFVALHDLLNSVMKDYKKSLKKKPKKKK